MNRSFYCTLFLAGTAFCWAAKLPVLENQAVRLELQPSDGSLRLLDRRTNVAWTLPAPLVRLKDQRSFAAKPSGDVRASGGMLRYQADHGTEFQLRLVGNPPSIHYSFTPGPEVAEVSILHDSLPLEPGEENYYALPYRIGIRLAPEGEKPFRQRMPAYTGIGYSRTTKGIPTGYSMAMFGAVQKGSALLVTWEPPFADLSVDYSGAPQRRLTAGLALRNTARWVRLQPLGRGGYVEIAKAYRPIARERGYLRTHADKIRETPSVERMFGAANIKPFVFSRRPAKTRNNPTDKDVLNISFTFEEAADLAEHYRTDLGMDRAFLVLAGWINGGYDIRHPDILPAAPEVGGNDELIKCSKRVKELGWLFGLHDNYQDIYRDSPSWDEDLIMRRADGSLHQGGIWAGGQCWLICSKLGLGLAKRPRNIPRVRELFAPTIYFSDTLFNAPPYQCFDPKHPLTIEDDIRYKRELAAYLRGQFGLFGSEEGREWCVPVSDYLEGLMSQKTGWRSDLYAFGEKDVVIPLFELVYADATALYSHQGDRPKPDNPTYILDHLLYAEMPVYYFGTHRYWKDPGKDYQPPAGAESRMVFARGGRFGIIDQFIRNTYEVLSPVQRLTALMQMTDHRFLTPDRKVEATRFGSDVEITVNYGPAPFTTRDAVLPQYGFLVESPTLVAFYASRYRGVAYSDPALIVLRSRDGRPLSTSRNLRIYRGFGDGMVELKGKVVEIEGDEKIVTTGKSRSGGTG